MKRLFVFFLLLAVLAALVAGCGGSGGESGNGGNAEADDGSLLGPVNKAGDATCAANRRIITDCAQKYAAMEGAYPSSIQQLVPDYLQSVPVCPSGGTYSLQGGKVACSVHGS